MVSFNGNSVSYDLDGNMLNNGADTYTYDSANRLITAGGHTYTYNAEDIRIRDLCLEEDTAYTYNNNCKLSKLLMKTSGSTVTKYVYGRGLIGEETSDGFKTYHFDCRGSTVALTDIIGNITDTFEYDTYGRLTARTGSTPFIFGYNGRDGVITDQTGLIYMRARYYSPDMKRFINADVVAGKLSKAITLNRYAYANGNPVSLTDPFGLSADIKGSLDTEQLFETLSEIKSKKDTGFASQLLASMLDQLLSFRNILTVSNKVTITLPMGVNTSITYSTGVKSGNGNINVEAVVAKQLDLAGSFSFPMGENSSISVADDGTINIEYSSNIDKYTTVAVSLSAGFGASISAGYIITTTDDYNNAVTTSIELKHVASKPPYEDNGPQPTGRPVLKPQPGPAPGYAYEYDWEYADEYEPSLEAEQYAYDAGPVLKFFVAIFATVGAGIAIGETFASYGAGAWNDPAAVATAVEA